MLTLLITAAVLAACTGLRRFLNREGRKDRTFWGGRIRLTALWNDGAAFSLPLKRTGRTSIRNRKRQSHPFSGRLCLFK